MSNALTDSVRKYLASHHMFVVEEWVSGFVEYFTEENPTSNAIEIQNCAKEQWLLNNLCDICPGSLPENVNSQQKCVLKGKFVLQINKAVDIGTPAYQQYLKLKKVNMENVEATIKYEEKVPSHRMMKLYMTDGKQEVSGIEYKPMRNISCDITPGCKVMIQGPVECRRGVLLLTEANVELLGGEVSDIVSTHSLYGILASKFGSIKFPEADYVINIEVRHPNIETPHVQAPRTNNAQTNSQVKPPSIRVANFNDDDIDFDQLEAIEAQLLDNPAKRPMVDEHPKPEKKIKINPEPVNTAEDYPNDDDLYLDEDNYYRQMEDDFTTEQDKLPAEVNPEPVNSADYPDDDDLCQNEDEFIRDLEDDSTTHQEIPPAINPFVKIKDIISLPEDRRNGRVFKIRGRIMKLLSKLSVGKEGWSLKCTIVDVSEDTGIDVEFASDVLSEVVGYTPQEMNQIKKQMASQPDLKEKAVLALQKAKDTLQVRCVIELTMLDRPIITKFTPLEEYREQNIL